MTADPSRSIVLVATMRNEGPFILEWVAFHRAAGFTDIVICTNDCADDSPLLVDRLQSLGLVTHLAQGTCPEKPQLAAYARAEQLPVVRQADWLMVLDADEFLNIHVGDGTVPALIDAVPDATAFLLSWRLFGHSGHDTFAPGFVTERFARAARLRDPVNLSFKTLFTRADVYGCRLLPHGPGFADPARIPELAYVNGAGRRLSSHFATARDFLQLAPEEVAWDLAQVNHYNIRSRDDYLVKHHRGGGLDIPWELEASWAIFNKNDAADRSIARHLPRTRTLHAALLADPELRRLDAHCAALYGAHIAALKTAGRAA